MKKKQVILAILDGWGIAPPSKGNAISLAKTPTYNYLLKTYPNTKLVASGVKVGLPKNQDGNSERSDDNGSVYIRLATDLSGAMAQTYQTTTLTVAYDPLP
jgi:hypothetical protein